MSDIAINRVLQEMQRLSVQASGLEQTPGAPGSQAAGAAFADILNSSLNEVEALSASASASSSAFQRGDPEVDIAEVMIALEKASLAFEAVTQTRNRLLTAYRDVMNMSV